MVQFEDDIQKDMKMTYLFDAKYRIASKLCNGVDVPPDDAINQMHRYRDAIYYRDYAEAPLKKEVIGGYIFFPGDGKRMDSSWYRFWYHNIRMWKYVDMAPWTIAMSPFMRIHEYAWRWTHGYFKK